MTVCCLWIMEHKPQSPKKKIPSVRKISQTEPQAVRHESKTCTQQSTQANPQYVGSQETRDVSQRRGDARQSENRQSGGASVNPAGESPTNPTTEPMKTCSPYCQIFSVTLKSHADILPMLSRTNEIARLSQELVDCVKRPPKDDDSDVEFASGEDWDDDAKSASQYSTADEEDTVGQRGKERRKIKRKTRAEDPLSTCDDVSNLSDTDLAGDVRLKKTKQVVSVDLGVADAFLPVRIKRESQDVDVNVVSEEEDSERVSKTSKATKSSPEDASLGRQSSCTQPSTRILSTLSFKAQMTLDDPCCEVLTNSNDPGSKAKVSSDEPSSKARVTCDEPSTKAKVSSDEPSSKARVTYDEPSTKEKVSCDESSLKAKVTCDEPSTKEKVSHSERSSKSNVICDEPSTKTKVSSDEPSSKARVSCDEPSTKAMVSHSEHCSKTNVICSERGSKTKVSYDEPNSRAKVSHSEHSSKKNAICSEHGSKTKVTCDDRSSKTKVSCDELILKANASCDELSSKARVTCDGPSSETKVSRDELILKAKVICDETSSKAKISCDEPSLKVEVIYDESFSKAKFSCDEPSSKEQVSFYDPSSKALMSHEPSRTSLLKSSCPTSKGQLSWADPSSRASTSTNEVCINTPIICTGVSSDLSSLNPFKQSRSITRLLLDDLEVKQEATAEDKPTTHQPHQFKEEFVEDVQGWTVKHVKHNFSEWCSNVVVDVARDIPLHDAEKFSKAEDAKSTCDCFTTDARVADPRHSSHAEPTESDLCAGKPTTEHIQEDVNYDEPLPGKSDRDPFCRQPYTETAQKDSLLGTSAARSTVNSSPSPSPLRSAPLQASSPRASPTAHSTLTAKQAMNCRTRQVMMDALLICEEELGPLSATLACIQEKVRRLNISQAPYRQALPMSNMPLSMNSLGPRPQSMSLSSSITHPVVDMMSTDMATHSSSIANRRDCKFCGLQDAQNLSPIAKMYILLAKPTGQHCCGSIDRDPLSRSPRPSSKQRRLSPSHSINCEESKDPF